MSKALRLNTQIRISPIRVINENQDQLGVITLDEALRLSREAGLDLVEVSPTERPPVCRIMDYGKFKYDRKKRTKQASSAHTHDLKEIRIRPKTDTHDRSIKLKRAIGFLEEGRKVQFTMLFRGRERFHKERAVNIFDGILEELGETVKVERRPIMDGRRMTMVVSPVKAGGPKPPKPQKKTPQPAKAKKPPTTAGAPPVKADATPTAASAPPVQADVSPETPAAPPVKADAAPTTASAPPMQADVSPETPAAPVVKADATPTETDAAPDAPKTSDTPAPLP